MRIPLTERTWPTGFLWGSATAAAQIEGAAHEGGKEDSIWDAYSGVPGAVANGDTPEQAVDHYHRVPSDVAIMKDLGLDSYRFSTSWARVVPGGRSVNQEGLDFYSSLVDELLDQGILPWLTLYHWDLPQALQEEGGWANRETAYRFVEYAEAVYGALGDRVTHWTTFNEPLCSSLIGYVAGEHAPGLTDPDAGLAALHHQHLAHGLAAARLRELAARDGRELQIGITLNLTNAVPNNPTDPVDLEAARRIDGLWNRMYLEPLLLGEYPADVIGDLAEYDFLQYVQGGDLAVISTPIDFLGVNHYHDDNVSGHPAAPDAAPGLVPTDKPGRSPFVGSEYVTFPTRHLPRTAMGWEVNPDGLRTLLVRLGREYPTLPPLYITENGAAYEDEIVDGAVHDAERWAYIDAHISAVGEAIDAGADVRGYFVWSLLDNYEWAWGYNKRFGIVHVDYDTLVRTPKFSATQYASIIAASKASV
ncbi:MULTISPECIES: glycoside hydrolase family 1 protein [unclassified Leifsonia]|uniref:glycoside hydrolase family 1 protein n=1 Tax=unclassified Leifsonia TaxID=2663824 RepID=UPI000700D457|nr:MULTISPECIES: family 1 glycosylhydrolase [unclassified Leifsonia]KQX05282.1 beta-glucosidase [Leifsonia sp. Root1293]KRA08915.1 beta-glucosidase [Leifsonia sp. Root60]